MLGSLGTHVLMKKGGEMSMYGESELDSQHTASAIGQCFTSRDVRWL
jgi:hypothetical protein